MRPRTYHRRAFSLIELLIAMGILVVLMGMLFLGGRAMLSSTKTTTTKATLATLAGMLAEFDSKTRMATPPPYWRWLRDNSTGEVTQTNPLNLGPAEVRSDCDFWKIPYISQQTSWRGGDDKCFDALDAPGPVAGDSPGAESYAIRNGSRQILNTQVVMQMLYMQPANRQALVKIPVEKQFIPAWCGGQITKPSAAAVLYYGQPNGSESVHFLFRTQIQHEGKRYICKVKPGVDKSSSPAGVPDQSDWDADLSPANPILLDAWSNPILFVSGTGLRVRRLNGRATIETNEDTQTFIDISPEGKVDYTTDRAHPRVITVGRPFFASAGEDGDFAKADDNIYSFQP